MGNDSECECKNADINQIQKYSAGRDLYDVPGVRLRSHPASEGGGAPLPRLPSGEAPLHSQPVRLRRSHSSSALAATNVHVACFGTKHTHSSPGGTPRQPSLCQLGSLERHAGCWIGREKQMPSPRHPPPQPREAGRPRVRPPTPTPKKTERASTAPPRISARARRPADGGPPPRKCPLGTIPRRLQCQRWRRRC